MEKIVYTKYSTERADKFKIVTSIVRDTNSKKRVEKRARHKEAKSHIESLSHKYRNLKTYYKDSSMEVVPCDICDSKAVFPFVEGQDLESILDQCSADRDIRKFLADIENYRRIITEHIDLVPFQVCEEFIQVFGQEYPKTGVDAFTISNIDLIFSNIIVADDTWKIIDYEWVFDFLVPVDYVVYRAVKNYIEMSVNRSWLADSDIYSLLGFSLLDRKRFDSMDRYFQKYVAGDAVTLENLYQNMSTKAVNLSDIIIKNLGVENNNEIQVFYDIGSGYSEENSYKIYPSFDQLIKFEIELNESAKAVRFDPGREFCVVKVISAIGEGKDCYDLDISSNGVEIGNGFFVFLTEDPQFYIQEWNECTNRVRIEVMIQMIRNEIAVDLFEIIDNFKTNEFTLINSVNELKSNIKEFEIQKQILLEKIMSHENKLTVKDKVIEENEHKISELKIKAEEAEQRYQMIVNSHFWRMTKPFRIAVSKVKKIWKG